MIIAIGMILMISISKADTTIILIDDPLDDIACGDEDDFEDFIEGLDAEPESIEDILEILENMADSMGDSNSGPDCIDIDSVSLTVGDVNATIIVEMEGNIANSNGETTSSEVNVFEFWLSVFVLITTPIALLFEFITTQIVSIFNGIPTTCVDFIIAILTYGTLAFLLYFKKKSKDGWKVVCSIIYYLVLAVTILYIIWKTRLVSLLDENAIGYDNIAMFFINLMYVLLAIGIMVVFYRSENKREALGENNRIKVLKTVIKIFIWTMFLLITFVISPIFDGFLLTMDTFVQTGILFVYFSVPMALVLQNNEDGDD